MSIQRGKFSKEFKIQIINRDKEWNAGSSVIKTALDSDILVMYTV